LAAVVVFAFDAVEAAGAAVDVLFAVELAVDVLELLDAFDVAVALPLERSFVSPPPEPEHAGPVTLPNAHLVAPLVAKSIEPSATSPENTTSYVCSVFSLCPPSNLNPNRFVVGSAPQDVGELGDEDTKAPCRALHTPSTQWLSAGALVTRKR
jgi:hypothetical protein